MEDSAWAVQAGDPPSRAARKDRRGPDTRSTDRIVDKHLPRRDPPGPLPAAQPAILRHFLAADFDGPGAMLDALSYVKAARALGVPACLEVSRSGHRRARLDLLHRPGPCRHRSPPSAPV